MPKWYVVRQGDGLQRIAFEHGLAPRTVWEHPENEELRERRQRGDVLLPGDRLFIPDIRPKELEAVTGKRHVFRRHGVPARLRLRVCEEGAPVANAECILEIDGVRRKVLTDEEGIVDVAISPAARSGRLIVSEDGSELALLFGHLDPLDAVSGIQGRLRNLDLYRGSITGELDDATRTALREFQRRHGLTETGEPDERTLSLLSDVHESESQPT